MKNFCTSGGVLKICDFGVWGRTHQRLFLGNSIFILLGKSETTDFWREMANEEQEVLVGESEEPGNEEYMDDTAGPASGLRRRKGKIMSCAKETIENGERKKCVWSSILTDLLSSISEDLSTFHEKILHVCGLCNRSSIL